MPKDTPAPVIPEASYFSATEGDYEALWAGLNEAGGYIKAATHDDDGNEIAEADRVWVQSSAPTNQAIPSPDEARYEDGEAIVILPKKILKKYAKVLEGATKKKRIKGISKEEAGKRRGTAKKRAPKALKDHKESRAKLKTTKRRRK
jgi:hypothetical protein